MNTNEQLEQALRRIESLERIVGVLQVAMPQRVNGGNEFMRTQAAIGDAFGIEPRSIMVKRRRMDLVIPRWVAWFILRDKFGMSLQRIGEIYNCHHSAVMHGVNRLRDLMSVEPKLKEKAEAAMRLV